MRNSLRVLASSIAGAALLALSSAALAQTPSGTCQTLAKASIAGAAITSAEIVAAGRFVPPSANGAPANPPFTDLGPFCRVISHVKGAGTSVVTIEVWLPLSGWNQEVQPAGSSFWGGSIPYARMREILRSGAVTAGSNLGITGATGPSFVVEHSEWMTNLGNAPFHTLVEQAKMLAAAFYGRTPTSTMMNECGGGGSRDVLAETQRWPADLDAAAAIGFTNYGTHHGVAQMWLYWATHKDAASYIPAEKYPFIHQAVLNACDAKDGVKDGIVEDPQHCAFDPGVLACRGADAANCLMPAQVAALRTIYETPKHGRTHEPLYGPMVPGSEFSWEPMTLQSHPYPYSEAFYRYVIFRDARWDYKNWKPDFAADVDRADAPGNLVINATNADISAFVDRGGKLLLMGGWNDDLGPGNNITYYESVRRALGYSETRNAVRLFMVPGMNHCLDLAYDSTYTVHFDPIAALRGWKQTGRAPDDIVVTTQEKNQSPRPRKVCAYPKISQYRGAGSVDDPKNFICREP
ncbi:MAG TPA: tannase/feruloyl esterase family alpha/beta hydrolase [Vicinamibacterales bacterium]|nr:tannase/feruloyl esterase family alpha/beta hydrolase [Vicinamibacterales bacterium]